MERKRRVLALSVAFTIAYALLLYIIIELTSKENSPSQNGTTEDKKSSCFISNKLACIVVCSDTVDYKIETAVNKLNFVECHSNEVYLRLDKIRFKHGHLSRQWLQNLKRNVTKLEIFSIDLKNIGNAVFSQYPFVNLKDFMIHFQEQLSLNKDNFLGSRLRTLNIEGTETANLKLEHDCLKYISPTLVSLRISRSLQDAWAIRNITGPATKTLRKLKFIDLRNNDFPTLFNKSFISVPNLETLLISNCFMKRIERFSFENVSHSLTTLSLRNNYLTTLPEGMFDNFTKQGRIDITGNQWNCNCNMAWFWIFYRKNYVNYFESGEIFFTCAKGNYSTLNNCETSVSKTTSAFLTSTSASSSSSHITTPTSSKTTSPISETTSHITLPTKITRLSTDQPLKTTLTSKSTTVKITPGEISTTQNSRTTTEKQTTRNKVTSKKSDTQTSSYSSSSKTSVFYSSTMLPCSTIIPGNTTTEIISSMTEPLSTINHLTTAAHSMGLVCREALSPETHTSSNRIYSHTNRIRNNTVFLDFYNVEDTPNYEVKINYLNSINMNFIWINSNDARIFGCISKFDNTVDLTGLQFSNNYILCLVRDLNTISPFDCTTLTTLELYGDQPWLLNKSKNKVLTVLSIATALIVLVCCLLTYFCTRNIRQYDRKDSDLTTTLYDKNEYTATANSLKSDGYVTPDTRSTISSKSKSIDKRENEFIDSNVINSTTAECPPVPPNHPNGKYESFC